jgi:hypothetical protein
MGKVLKSGLALVLRKRLEDCLAAGRLKSEWGALLMDLDRLQEIEAEQEGKRFILRTPVTGDVGRAFQAVGVALRRQLSKEDMRHRRFVVLTTRRAAVPC